MKFSSVLAGELAGELAGAVRQALRERARAAPLSRSQPDLSACQDLGELRRSSWYSGPSEVSLDDTDLILSKEARRMPSGPLSRTRARRLLRASLADLGSFDDGVADRRSLASVSSGVYEEITEEAAPREEHTYESVADCVYATWRRTGKRHPPPLPPRTPALTMKLGEGWGRAGDGVTRHSSLGSLHHKPARPAKPFSVFRKRLKSDSRIATSPKSETAKEKDVETKKKKFDFTPTRDIFKSFKVSRKMKNLKITSGGLTKGETKSCEFLDETQHVSANRCSKSVECLDGDGFDEFDGQLALVPQELVQLILRAPERPCESEYMPMSPIVPAPCEHHYMVMSPRTKLA